MAERKNSGRSRAKKSNKPQNLSISLIFWAAFFVIIIVLFLAFSPVIKENFSILAQGLNLPEGLIPKTEAAIEPDTAATSDAAEEESAAGQQPANQPVSVPVTQQPVVQPPAELPTTASPPSPAAQTPAATTPPAAQTSLAKPVETRDRNIYFTQIDKDGTVLRARAARQIPVSDSPMMDSLNALLLGPSAEEQRRGLVSLIPGNTRILSAFVRGNTAYISFSDDFLYNTYGVEGYAAQLRQIIWTATEFSNVNDVQFQIEGRRVDYLGEGIWIGSPLGRDSL